MAIHRISRAELLAAPSGGFGHERLVRLQDVDAAGVVFFARYLEYFHDALFAYLDHTDLDLGNLLDDGEMLAPIKHVEADYVRPLRFADRIDVRLLMAHIEQTQVTIGYRVELLPARVPVAVGQTAHVAVDPENFERRPWPEAMLRVLEGINR